jgi:uncharacterized protein (UPF0332 family)
MKSDAFLEFAQWAIDNNKSPASCRSAISRAYYAAFHCTVEFLDSMEIRISKTDNRHERAPDILGQSQDVDINLAARMLDQLRKDRNEADYELTNRDWDHEVEVEFRIHSAKRVIGILNTCMTGKGMAGSRFELAKPLLTERAGFLRLGPKK